MSATFEDEGTQEGVVRVRAFGTMRHENSVAEQLNGELRRYLLGCFGDCWSDTIASETATRWSMRRADR